MPLKHLLHGNCSMDLLVMTGEVGGCPEVPQPQKQPIKLSKVSPNSELPTASRLQCTPGKYEELSKT